MPENSDEALRLKIIMDSEVLLESSIKRSLTTKSGKSTNESVSHFLLSVRKGDKTLD